jgi:hypothetical protein
MLCFILIVFKYCSFVLKEVFFERISSFFSVLKFYRHPIFHNYFALVYFIVGLNTVLYLVGISDEQFMIQLGMFAPVKGRFWYDVFPEFINGTLESKRLPIYLLDDLFVFSMINIGPFNYYFYYYFYYCCCFFLKWVT